MGQGWATVSLETREEMRADDRGLVHGGFVFGLADYAAMLAVNDPNVVLGQAQAKFLAPVKVGTSLLAEAKVQEEAGRKRTVLCSVKSGDREVFSGIFSAVVLDRHVFDL
jgi:acyl-coenzyme A thioesterase PaaI-like protein